MSVSSVCNEKVTPMKRKDPFIKLLEPGTSAKQIKFEENLPSVLRCKTPRPSKYKVLDNISCRNFLELSPEKYSL